MSLFIPYSIVFSSGSFYVIWTGNFFFTNTPPLGTTSLLGNFYIIMTYQWDNPLYNSGIWNVVLISFAMIFVIVFFSFLALRIITYTKKTESSNLMNYIKGILIGCVMMGIAIISFLIPIYFSEGIKKSLTNYDALNPFFNLHFYTLLIGSIMIIIGFSISIKNRNNIQVENVKIDILDDEEKNKREMIRKMIISNSMKNDNDEKPRFCGGYGSKMPIYSNICEKCGWKDAS